MNGEWILEVNERGSWRRVLTFPESRTDDVLDGIGCIAKACPNIKWAVRDPDGRRTWIGVSGYLAYLADDLPADDLPAGARGD